MRHAAKQQRASRLRSVEALPRPACHRPQRMLRVACLRSVLLRTLQQCGVT